MNSQFLYLLLKNWFSFITLFIFDGFATVNFLDSNFFSSEYQKIYVDQTHANEHFLATANKPLRTAK
jgi:hypothetical protein